MSRKNKVTKPEYKFAARIETGDLEQQVSNLLSGFSFTLDKIGLKNTTSDIFTLLFNQGYYEDEVVIVPRSILDRVYTKLIDSGLKTRLGKHPRLESPEISKKFAAIRRANKKRK